QVGKAPRAPCRDLRKRRVVEHDVRRDLVSTRALEAPPFEHGVDRIVRVGLTSLRRLSANTELAEERARPLCPRDEEMTLGARQADVEELAFFRDLSRRLGKFHRQLLLLEMRDEDRLELEPLGAVERQEMDAAPRFAPV